MFYILYKKCMLFFSKKNTVSKRNLVDQMAYAKDTWKDLWKNYDLGCTEFKYTDLMNFTESMK